MKSKNKKPLSVYNPYSRELDEVHAISKQIETAKAGRAFKGEFLSNF